MNGVLDEEIHIFKPKDKIFCTKYVLLTRYKLQAELSHVFNCRGRTPKSVLWPAVDREDLKCMKEQYRFANGKPKGENHCLEYPDKTREPQQDCMTRLVKEAMDMKDQGQKPLFRCLVIDESHFLVVRESVEGYPCHNKGRLWMPLPSLVGCHLKYIAKGINQ